YELHVKTFHDSDGDGIGDFRGLIEKLDYLQELGVTALWLLPFYPSPMRDDGYDIADYYDVNPNFGTLDDFRAFLAAAHERMLLAEANQWPEDAVAYFGKGDESHMNFHFPLMPRMFMSLQMEDRFPILDILDQTPPIPENCQWAMFLRNHDELTLEMVTDEERD